MSSKVEKRIIVDVPVGTAYNQWTQFEDFPHFMDGVESVTQLSDDRLKWVARIAGVRREWDATILEQVPDRRVAWASTGGVTNSGAVEFSDAGGNRTEVALTLEYLPEGMLERVGDLLHVVGRQADHDLKKFKDFIEHEGHATGAWRKPASGTAGAARRDCNRRHRRKPDRRFTAGVQPVHAPVRPDRRPGGSRGRVGWIGGRRVPQQG